MMGVRWEKGLSCKQWGGGGTRAPLHEPWTDKGARRKHGPLRTEMQIRGFLGALIWALSVWGKLFLCCMLQKEISQASRRLGMRSKVLIISWMFLV